MESRQQLFGSADPQRLFKAKVHVCGRFLLRPEEDFGPERAEELMKRSARDGVRVRTSLHLYNTGFRLGDKGVFASMPLEFIKYQRVAACISPRQQQPRMLTICTKDYDQKCVTIVQFKNQDALAEASRLIDRQLRLVAEEANYLMDTPRRSGPSSNSNWALETPAGTTAATVATVAATAATPAAPPPGPMDRRPALFRRDITGPPSQPMSQPPSPERHETRIVATTARTASASTDDVFYASASAAAGVADARDAGSSRRNGVRRIDSVIVGYEDVTAAVFESNHGPPTLLNERVVTSQSRGASNRPTTLRVQTEEHLVTARRHEDQVDGVASERPHVTYVAMSANGGHRVNGGLQYQHQQQQVLQLQPPPQQQQTATQQMQLVRLVPVRRRQHSQRHHPSQHQQQFALVPASSRGSQGRGLYLMSK